MARKPDNSFLTQGQFVAGVVRTFKVEKARWLALSPEEQMQELAKMTPQEQHWIEHGGDMPPMSSGIEA